MNDLAKAEALRDSLIARSKSESAHGVRIDECVQKYLSSHKHELGEKTYGQTNSTSGVSSATASVAASSSWETVNLLETFKVDGLPGLQNRPSSRSLVAFCEKPFVAGGFNTGGRGRDSDLSLPPRSDPCGRC